MPFMTINSEAFPYLVFGDGSKKMPWHHGTIYSLRLKSTYLRFTERGMQYSTSSSPPWMQSTLWKHEACMPCPDGLCAFKPSGGNMVWFPTTAVDIPDDFSNIPGNRYLDSFGNASACSSAKTGRAVSMFDERYEVSLCDLLDSNLDVVFDHGTIYWRQDTTGTWVYLTISILCIYLVSCISDNIVAMLHNHTQSDSRQQIYTVYGSIVLIMYLLFVQETYGLLLTVEDRDLTIHLFLYVLAQTAAQHTDIGDDMHGSRISLLTACIALLTLRVHYSFDNPYMLVLCVLFGVRSFYKFVYVLVKPHSSPSGIIFMLADFFVFCSMLDNGLMANSVDVFSGAATQVVLVLVCALVSVLVFTYKACRGYGDGVVV